MGFAATKMLRDSRIALPLGIAMGLLLFLPGTSSADIESLYAEGYSSSVAITNPSNAYGAPDGNMAESTDKEKWGVFLQNWTFFMADSANTTEVFQSAEFYFTHYVGNGYFDDYIDLEYSPDNGENWYLLKRYTELDPPPTSLTTEGPFPAPVITSWTKVDSAQFRIIGKGRILGEDVFGWFVDAVEMRVQYAISLKLTLTGTGIAPATVNAGDQDVGMERIVLDPGADTVTVNSITVTRTGTAKPSDVGTVSLYDDSGSTLGSFDPDDVEVPGASGMFFDTTVTVTPTTPITLTGAPETYYIVYDVPLGAVNGRTLGARINSGIDVNSDADIVLPGGGGCFIATAAYGSHAEGHVITLRRFRDQYLLLNAIGRSLVHLYERYSPGLAKLINHNQHLIPITRVGLSPLVGLSALFGWVDLPQRWPLLVTMAVIISVLTYMELLVRRQRGFTRD